MDSRRRFSLVSTVFNERKRLGETIADIEAQTLRPDEIVITDAGSTDGTFEMLNDWSARSSIPIVILRKHRCNVAEGRNLAIEKASHSLIVSTDFGCRFHPRWLESITEPFFIDPHTQVAGGAFSVLEDKIHSVAAKANYVLSDGYNVNLDDRFIPSSRSIAYNKHVWNQVGRYCEWLTLAADDLVFGKSIRAQGIPITLVAEPLVYWGRHEKLKAYAKEAYRYGLGDGEARVNGRNVISIAGETLLRYFLFVGILMILVNSFGKLYDPMLNLAQVIGLLGLRSYVNAFRNWMKYRSSKYDIIVFVTALYLIEISRLNYLKGYVKGFYFSNPEVKAKARELKAILR